VDCSITSDVV